MTNLAVGRLKNPMGGFQSAFTLHLIIRIHYFFVLLLIRQALRIEKAILNQLCSTSPWFTVEVTTHQDTYCLIMSRLYLVYELVQLSYQIACLRKFEVVKAWVEVKLGIAHYEKIPSLLVLQTHKLRFVMLSMLANTVLG